MQMPFPQMYRQRVRGGCIGPVSICQHIDLLVKYASFYPQDVQWLTFIQFKGVDKIYEVLLTSGWVQNYHARAKAQSSILNFCEEQRLPVKKHSFIVVSHRSHILPVRRWYGQTLNAFRSVMPYMCEYMESHTCVTVSDPAPWSQHLVNIQGYCRRFQSSSLFEPDVVHHIRAAWFGFDMLRLPVPLKIPSCFDNEQAVHVTRQACATWRQSLVGILSYGRDSPVSCVPFEPALDGSEIPPQYDRT